MFDQLENKGMLEAMYLDRVAHKLKHREALRHGLLSEYQVFRRWLVK